MTTVQTTQTGQEKQTQGMQGTQRIHNQEIGSKSKERIIEIISYGDMPEHDYQLKIDNITILGGLHFKSIREKRFELHSENECNEIIFQKQNRLFSLKHEKLPVLPLDKILSRIYWEAKKNWEGSLLQKIEMKKVRVVGCLSDDAGKNCFITFLVGDLHRKRIIISSTTETVDYLFPENYVILTKDFSGIQNTTRRFFGEN